MNYWVKLTDLRSPQGDRHLYDSFFFFWTNQRFVEVVAVADSALERLGDRIAANLWINAHQSVIHLNNKKKETHDKIRNRDRKHR